MGETLAKLLTPLNSTALPTFPVVQVGLITWALLPKPEESTAVRPLPSSNFQYATGGVGGVSFSVMVSTAVLGEPRVAPPVGLLRVRLTVLFTSKTVLSMMGMVTVLLAVSPSAKVTV